jgi:transcriptional regulator with XRE-family HTH domain
VNERLRAVMQERGTSLQQLANACAVDPKTVERWIKLGRSPHAKHRRMAAKILQLDEAELWPEAERSTAGQAQLKSSELVTVYPNRATVPRDTWLSLLDAAEQRIDILVFSGTFLAQTNPRIAKTLAQRAAAGAEVRLCFGDPLSESVAVRDREEGLQGTLPAKIRASMTYYRDLLSVDRSEIRQHGTTLYASLFRYDDQMLVNPHIWGQPASANPLLHLQRSEDAGWFDLYSESFDAVWEQARQWTPTEGNPNG